VGQRGAQRDRRAASRQGEFAQVDPALGRLIGRPPMTVRDFLQAALSPAG
jgi:hypothetical protein